ncbi:MAG: hypothetical protein HY862_16595 [Chloroflexi bacterium]|nr:hypothetical protein [Chloroflexota bacterium]
MSDQAADNAQNTGSVEHVGRYVTRELIDNGRITVYHLLSIKREAVDEWITSALETFKNWPSKEPFLVIYDFLESGGLTLTPYIRKRSQELAVARPELMGRAAIVLPRTIGAQAAKMFVLISLQKSRQRRVFFTMDEALAWIRKPDNELGV